MSVLSRRQFIGAIGAAGFVSQPGVASLFASPPRGRAALTYAELDPRNASNFTRRLRLPSRDGGLLGIFEPSSAFDIRAIPSTQEIVPGTQTTVWNYEVEAGGKRFANPIIKIAKNGRINATLKNTLTEETIIHWHGLRVDSKNDAHPRYAIRPGESYQYDFTIPNQAGNYWYHPHAHGMTGEQIYLGLASFMLVEDQQEIDLRNTLDLNLGETDIPLIVQERRFDNGRFGYQPDTAGLISGFLGDVVLVNLSVNPFMDVRPRTYRFRILNASNARSFRLALTKGAQRIPFSIIGNDGGLLDRPYQVSEVFVAPAERVDVLVDMKSLRDGDVLFLESLAFEPLHNEHDHPEMIPTRSQQGALLDDGARFNLLKLNVKGSTAYDRQVPARFADIPPIPTDPDGVKRRFGFVAPDYMHRGEIEWRINGLLFNMDQIPVSVRKGAIETWEMINDLRSMPHPMHLHGFPFQVLERSNTPDQARIAGIDGNGRLPTDKGWKDTVLVWPGEAVKVAVDFSHNFAGEQIYLYHCHILEHQDRGMMINYKVT